MNDAARAELAAKLRRLRIDSGVTGTQLAKSIGCSQSRISKIETGHLLPNELDIRIMATVLNIRTPIADALVEDARSLAPTDQFTAQQIPSWQAVVELEKNAAYYRILQTMIIPGLLQVPDYTRALLRSQSTWSNNIEDLIAQRLTRQAEVYKNDRDYHLLITEAVLSALVAEPETIALQLKHLVSRIHEKRMRIGVVPATRQLVTVPSFALYADTAVLTELLDESFVMTNKVDIANYSACFENAAQLAVYGDDAAELVERAHRQLLEGEATLDIRDPVVAN